MEYTVNAASRDGKGRGEARALRRAGRVPGVIYGGGEARAFSCEAGQIAAFMQEEAFHSSVVAVQLDGGEVRRALLREVQRDPVRRDILHIDFQAVSEDREISVQVPIHFVNADSAPGVKLQNGVFNAIENQVSVHCLPQNLPEYIEVDVGALEISKSIHLSEITPPAGVRFDDIVRGNDPALATIASIAEEVEPEPTEAAAEETAEATEEDKDKSSAEK